MLGQRGPQQLELLVPPPAVPDTAGYRLLCRIDALVDWEPIREKVADSFSWRGRPSIDPVVMVKMMVVGYLFGIQSDRALVEECSDRLSIRKFLRYGLSEELPCHASFTHWRQRLGSEFFRGLLHDIVAQCVSHGMELSTVRSVDATSVKAQASKYGPQVDVPAGHDVDEFLSAYFAGEMAGIRGPGSTPVNLHDPDARLQRKNGETAQFRYQASFCADVETRLITDATATARESAATAIEHLERDPFEVTEFVADALYDNGQAMMAIQARGVKTYVPKRDRNPTKLLEAREFIYDPETDEYVCPCGKRLIWSRYRADEELHYYLAKISDCKACSRKAECTTAKRRTVTRSAYAEGLEAIIRQGRRYRHLRQERSVNEHLNRMAKRDHCLTRARALGLESMKIQACLTAIAIDLKKLARWSGRRPKPGAVCLAQARMAPDRAAGGTVGATRGSVEPLAASMALSRRLGRLIPALRGLLKRFRRPSDYPSAPRPLRHATSPNTPF